MKKFINILLLAALLLVGACSDGDKDEPEVNPVDPVPDPSYTSEFPTDEDFENVINNNLWEKIEERFETEDGVDFPGILWDAYLGGPHMPILWYFWDNKSFERLAPNPDCYGSRGSNVRYNSATGSLDGSNEIKEYHVCDLLSLEDGILTIKVYLADFGDLGEVTDYACDSWDWAALWRSFPDKEKVINKPIYHIGRYKIVNDPALIEEIMSHYDSND